MSSPIDQIHSLYRRALADISEQDALCTYLLKIYQDLVLHISDSSLLQFNTLFARVSFIATRYHLSRTWTFCFQIARRELRQRQLDDAELIPIVQACIEYMLLLTKQGSDDIDVQKEIRPPALPVLPSIRKSGKKRKAFARVIATEWNAAEKTLQVLDEEDPGTIYTVHYCVTGVNDIFSDTLELALTEMGLPLTLGLSDIDFNQKLEYVPEYIIILPDLLLDVTAIADFTTSGSDPLSINLINQYLPTRTTATLLIGKLANYFLDELIRDVTIPFAELFSSTFKLYPLEFVRFSDQEVKGLMNQMKNHYETIRDVIEKKFPTLGIRQDDCIIEPSYFSPEYGIKGRLDLYYHHPGESTASIIELKSGKPFKPNSYGLSSSNYHQTLLYELLIKAVHGPKHNRANFILYSAVASNPLRYAVSVASIQKETIHNRNQLALLQFRLTRIDEEPGRDVFAEIDPARYDSIAGFLKGDMSEFHRVYTSLSIAERSYFKAFSAFIAREHMIARIGIESEDGAGGLAGLWLDDVETKEERYQIVKGLELIEIQKEKHQTQIIFQKTGLTNPLANFRAGDIAVMYPYAENGNDPTHYQLHRANVLAVDAMNVTIRLRNHQINTRQIETIRLWNLEHDLLDSSFRSLYQSLWLLMKTPVKERKLILGARCETPVVEREVRDGPSYLTIAQKEIFREGIRAEFLYLLWGPPGTGKTSVMLKSWVQYYYQHTSLNLLLVAFTNRAVDEICAALDALDGDIPKHYIRIGSRAATNEAYRNRLLDHVIDPMSKRSEIKSLLNSNRIVVGTVASIQGKPELFELMKFDVMLVDEASQLLEPAIVGLLTQTRKAILIGDHMQLPAVSMQSQTTSKLKAGHTWGKEMDITDLSMSYFERLYRLYQQRGWHHLIGSLHEQGRMHVDIMNFVNKGIYKGLLSCVDESRQQGRLDELFHNTHQPIFGSRLVFIPSSATLEETYRKTNSEEAAVVISLISFWKNHLEKAGMPWSIGVITPFRAQIAAILHLAHVNDIDLTGVTIDTVERYQGGARDIIIMSSAANHLRALEKISSLNFEGVDRKLNVAITRARQQFILTGVENILRQSEAYRDLIAASKRMDITSLLHDHPVLDQPHHGSAHPGQSK